MTQEQLFQELRANKLKYVVLLDWEGHKLVTIDEHSTDRAVKRLEDRLPNYTSYKRLIVNAKTDPSRKISESYEYELEMKGASKGEIATIGTPGSIGAMDYIRMHTDMMNKQFELQKELMEVKMKTSQQDPAAWMPIINAAMSFINGSPNPSIAGRNIYTGTMKEKQEEQTLTEKEIGEKIMQVQIELATKIKGSDYLKIIEGLNANPVIGEKIDKIITLIDGIAAKPDLIDMAIKFV